MSQRRGTKAAMGSLASLGLSAEQEGLYEALLDRPGSNVGELNGLVSRTRRSTERALETLEDLGLVIRSASRPPRFTPTPPATAFRALVRRRQDELEEITAYASRLQERFREVAGARAPIDLVEVVVGFDAAVHRAFQLRSAAREENLIFDKPPYAEGPETPREELDELGRGVHVRVIYDAAAFELPDMVREVEELAAGGEESRVLPNLPLKGGIFDRRIGIVPLLGASDEITGAIVVHASPMLKAMIVLFEMLWERATPLAFGGEDTRGEVAPLTARDRRILSLLAAGYTDDAIAHILDIADRTVGRQVARLMELLGVTTRFQLGAQASRLGWLPDDVRAPRPRAVGGSA